MKCFAGLCLVALLTAPAFAADGAPATKTADQIKNENCAKEAGDRKGNERKAFFKACLNGQSVPGSAAKVVSPPAVAAEKKAPAMAAEKKAPAIATETPKTMHSKIPSAAEERRANKIAECDSQSATQGLTGDARKKFIETCITQK